MDLANIGYSTVYNIEQTQTGLISYQSLETTHSEPNETKKKKLCKKKMWTDNSHQQPWNYIFLTRDKYLQNVEGLNMFSSTQNHHNLGQWCNNTQ